MRTTVDIDERTLARAKKLAASAGKTLGELLTDALAAYLPTRPREPAPPFELIVRGRPNDRFPSADEMERASDDEELSSLGFLPRAAP